MFLALLFVLLLIAIAAFLVALLINSIRLVVQQLRKVEKAAATRGLARSAVALVITGVMSAGIVGISQLTASTPAIRAENGNGAGSVAELKRVELNGRAQWISIRGHDRSKPVLLFLAGGPGGSQMAAVRHELAELEEHFVVVNWDQPGSGKSYDSVSGQLSAQTYVDDGVQLTRYLCQAFGQQKIYLVGESWGSALGVFLVAKAPERYHALIGTGQMVSFLDTEKIDYELARELAREKGDTDTGQRLDDNGPPPYFGSDVTWKSAAYLQYLSAHMAANPNIHNSGYNTMRDLFSSEYGLLDKINYFRGIVNTFNAVYPKLYDIDLRVDYPKLDVPVYFFIGRHDINAPTSLVQEYLSILEAPDKEIVWFEHSGHSPWINESNRFVDEVLRVTAGR